MIYQTDPEFPDPVHRWGCYFLSLCERMAFFYDLSLTYEYVLEILKEGQAAGIIDAEITLLNPEKVANLMIADKVQFVGKVDPFFVCHDDEFEILCFHKDGASFNHFCAGDGHGLVAYDPWSVEGSDSVKNGSVIGKRIFRRT